MLNIFILPTDIGNGGNVGTPGQQPQGEHVIDMPKDSTEKAPIVSLHTIIIKVVK